MASVSGRPRPLLVLDVGGVLLVDPMPILFDRLADASPRSCAEIRAFYQANIRNPFWAGTLSEDEFWVRLLEAAALDPATAPAWRDELMSWQAPMPAVKLLARWAEKADIEILSNHRTAWIRPLLSAAGVDLPAAGVDDGGLVRRALVSEETGLVKPDAEAFLAALEIAPPGGRVLFADDQPPNVRTARANGLPAIEVDPEGRWMARIDGWLSEA